MAYTVDLSSPIGQRWVALGGSTGVGDPTGPQKIFHLGTKSFQYQEFPNGVLTCLVGENRAYLLHPKIFNVWFRNTYGAVRLIGQATEDSFQTAFGSIASYFARGLISEGPGGAFYAVPPPIFDRYSMVADLHSSVKPAFGLPIEMCDDTFPFQRFENGAIFKTYIVAVDHLAKWQTADGFAVGLAAGDTFTMAFGGTATYFDHGVVVQDVGAAPVIVVPPEYDRYEALAALRGSTRPPLGLPLSDRIAVFAYQEFKNGAIFSSPSFGPVVVAASLYEKWRAPEVQGGVTEDGENLRDYLGRPTTDSFGTAEGGQAVYFERGVLVAHRNGQVFEVHGAIFQRYRTLGDLHGAVPYLGLPKSDQQVLPGGGAHSAFEHGDIYWHNDTGAWDVRGAIRSRYLDLGGPDGPMGFPTGGEEDVLGPNAALVGRMSRFAGPAVGWKPAGDARIYWNRATGDAWEVTREILRVWLRTGDDAGHHFGPVGPLGFPVSPETDTPTAAPGAYTLFENGLCVWFPGADPIVVRGLTVELTEFHAEEDFNVQVRLAATPTGETNNGRMPSDGEYQDGAQVFSRLPLLTIPRILPETVISVWLEAIHERPVGTDERLGRIDIHYTIDNLWGLFDTQLKWVAGDFDATFHVRPFPYSAALDPEKTVTQAFWPFKNFDTAQLTWHQYAETFTDVSMDDKPHFSWIPQLPQPFKWLFYELVYQGLADSGNCFGLCVEAIYALLNRSPFMEPIYSSPLNPYRKDGYPLDAGAPGDRDTSWILNIKQGYEVGSLMVAWSYAMWAAGKLNDPVSAFIQSRQQHALGQLPVLSISRDDPLSKHGHALMPYKWRGNLDGRSQLDIWVADPDDPGGTTDPGHSSHIWVFQHDNSFSYEHSPKDVWRGSEEGGGRLLSIPLALFNSQPRLPGSEWTMQFDSSAMLIVGGDADSTQITDEEGRTFYAPLPLGRGPQYRLPNLDPATRMPGVVRVPLCERPVQNVEEEFPLPPDARPLPPRPEPGTFYYLKRARAIPRESAGGPSVSAGKTTAVVYHELTMSGSGHYQWGYASGTLSVVLFAQSYAGGRDVHVLEQFAEEEQVLTLTFGADAPTGRTVAMAVGGWPGLEIVSAPWFRIAGIDLPPGHKLGLQMTNQGRMLSIVNEGYDLKYDMEIHRGVDPGAVGTRSRLTLPGRRVTTLRPGNWARTSISNTPIHISHSSTLGGPILSQLTV